MNIRYLLFGLFSCFFFSSLSAQGGFTLDDLHDWSKGNESPAPEVNNGIFDSDSYYRLTTQWQGDGKSLDIINDGKNITPILAKTGRYSGQAWKIKNVGKDTYTLTTAWRGPELKLDCIPGPNQNRPVLNKSDTLSSEWKITALGRGYYKITNSWLSGRSLDVVNDGKNNKIQAAKTGNYSGQMWKITKMK